MILIKDVCIFLFPGAHSVSLYFCVYITAQFHLGCVPSGSLVEIRLYVVSSFINKPRNNLSLPSFYLTPREACKLQFSARNIAKAPGLQLRTYFMNEVKSVPCFRMVFTNSSSNLHVLELFTLGLTYG